MWLIYLFHLSIVWIRSGRYRATFAFCRHLRNIFWAGLIIISPWSMNASHGFLARVCLILVFGFRIEAGFSNFLRIGLGRRSFSTRIHNLCIFRVAPVNLCSLWYETPPFFIIMRIFLCKNLYHLRCIDDLVLF